MGTRYLTQKSEERLEDVIDHMKAVVKIDIDINTAIDFLYNTWRDAIDGEPGGFKCEKPIVWPGDETK
jgi:hypothetical protein